MDVHILMFAGLREMSGRDKIVLNLPDGATVGDVVHEVERCLDKDIPSPLMVAVNETYASLDQVVHHGDEVVLIPPVAGG